MWIESLVPIVIREGGRLEVIQAPFMNEKYRMKWLLNRECRGYRGCPGGAAQIRGRHNFDFSIKVPISRWFHYYVTPGAFLSFVILMICPPSPALREGVYKNKNH